MRVLFIYPEHYLNIGIPGGISMLSANLKKHGHETALIDTTFMKVDPEFDSRTFDTKAMHQKLHGGLGEKEADTSGISPMKRTAYTIEDLVRNDPVVSYQERFQSAIDGFKPDLIAISSMTSTFDFVMGILRTVKYDCPVIAGGIHPTIAVDDCMAQKEIDIACYGEADNIMVELCDLMEAGKDNTSVKSMVFRMPDGSLKRNSPAPRVDNDDLPCPDWGLFDQRHLFRPFDGRIYAGSFYIQSRGCPMKCTYCVDSTVADMTGGHVGYFRHQKPEVTIRHLSELKEKFGVNWIKFADDSFLLPKIDHLEELGEGLKRLGIQFGCSVMPNTITEDKVRIAREMGCLAMSVGVESGNANIRKMVKRNYKDEVLIERLKNVQRHGIRLSTFNIIGFPGETRDNVFETINLNRRIGTSACNVYILFPYPGTPIQIEHKIPIRDESGKMLPVAKAKELRLSKMSPDELEGLQHTFNLYLHMPKELWPLVRLAEASDPRGLEIRKMIERFVVSHLSNDPPELVALEHALPPARAAQDTRQVTQIPAILAKIYRLELTDDEFEKVTDAFREHERASVTVESAPLAQVATA
jgi:radical SAM superfamily enzyme YgiQ (UPF0313 family)